MALTTEEFMEATEKCPVIPAAKNDEWLEACISSESDLVYVLYGDICSIGDIVQKIKDAGKKAIVHVDLIVGLSPKEISVDFLMKYTLADGVISMKPAMIKRAKELGMFSIQRFYTMVPLQYRECGEACQELQPGRGGDHARRADEDHRVSFGGDRQAGGGQRSCPGQGRCHGGPESGGDRCLHYQQGGMGLLIASG